MELLKEARLNFVALKCVLVFVETKQASKTMKNGTIKATQMPDDVSANSAVKRVRN